MRSVQVSDWAGASEWSGWDRVPMTGDASARRYERLSNSDGRSVILMDAPPTSCGSQARFVEIANHLRGLNLAAPEILDWDDALGLMILSDLGQQDFAKHLRANPSDEVELYTAARDVLTVLQNVTPPDGLARMTPDVGADMISLAFEWAADDVSPDLALEITARLHGLLGKVDPEPSVLSLRDFHAENLIWRPERSGHARVGLLDFQDAFVTHPMYDVASLLRDARRDVDPALVSETVRDADALPFHVMAVQRNLRILGIFNRLAKRDGKTGYLSLVPRVWSHLRTDLSADGMQDIRPLVLRAFETEATK